jgi:hypothetical protein
MLATNNALILMSLGIMCFYFLQANLLTGYRSNVEQVLQKYSFIQNSIINIAKPAEKFFQAAMKEILPPEQRRAQSASSVYTIDTNYIRYELPSYFADYEQLERSMLSINLCDYAYLNGGSLYNNINCSLILNGVMDQTYAETYVLFLALARNYTGVGLSQLGNVYRPGATYPVFMEICYTRRTLNNVFIYLQKAFSAKLTPFVATQNDSITGILYNAIYLLPLLLLVMGLEFRGLYNECYAVIKSFKLLPKRFLLNIRICRYLREHRLLDKLEMIPF